MNNPFKPQSGHSAAASMAPATHLPGSVLTPLEYGCVDWFDYPLPGTVPGPASSPTLTERRAERLDRKRS